MKSKRIFYLLTAAALSASLTGCSLNDEPGLGGLLTAPMMNEEQKQIHEALTESVGEDITLKYPSAGENRSAFVIANIDDEDTDEAIVFYQYTSSSLDDGTVRVNILDQDDKGGWFSAIDFQGAGAEIDRIYVTTLKENSAPSLVIGYSALSSGENQFQVYSYNDEVIDTVYTDTYSFITVIDLDEDGVYDILKTATDSDSGEETAAVLEREDDGFKSHTNIEMSGFTQSYASCKQLKTESGNAALYIDTVKTDGELLTDIITEGYGTYQNPSVIFKEKILDKTQRPAGYLTSDIDGDGIAEIPSVSTLYGYSEDDGVYLTSWSVYKNDFSLEEKYSGYYMVNDGYFLNFPSEFKQKVTVKYDQSTGESVFYRLDKTAEASETELFRINVVNSSDYSNYRALGYMLLSEQGQLKYVVKRTGTDDELCLKLDELKNNFYIVE